MLEGDVNYYLKYKGNLIMKSLLLTLIIGFSIPASVGATTWYVAKTGSDSNSCTQAQNSSTPRLTIAAGLNCIGIAAGAGAGHIVQIAAGTYVESLQNNLPSGTSWSAPFTLQAKTGDIVTIQASAAQYNFWIYGTKSMYLIVQGFVFDGSNLSNSQIVFGSCCDGPSSIRFIGNEIVNTARESAIQIGQFSGDIQFLNNKIHDGPFLTAANNAGYAHALYLTGNNSLIEGNQFYNLPNYAVHQYSQHTPAPSNNIIRNNLIYNFSKQTCCGAGVLLASGSGSQAYNNIIYNGAVGMDIGPSAYAYNNTIYNMSYVGIDVADNAGGAVRNNIIHTVADTPIWGFGGANSNNLCDRANNSSGVPCNVVGDARFVNMAGGNFHLQSTSPAINAGTTISQVSNDFDGVNRPQGIAYAIGAFEYMSGGGPTLLPPTNLSVTP